MMNTRYEFVLLDNIIIPVNADNLTPTEIFQLLQPHMYLVPGFELYILPNNSNNLYFGSKRPCSSKELESAFSQVCKEYEKNFDANNLENITRDDISRWLDEAQDEKNSETNPNHYSGATAREEDQQQEPAQILSTSIVIQRDFNHRHRDYSLLTNVSMPDINQFSWLRKENKKHRIEKPLSETNQPKNSQYPFSLNVNTKEIVQLNEQNAYDLQALQKRLKKAINEIVKNEPEFPFAIRIHGDKLFLELCKDVNVSKEDYKNAFDKIMVENARIPTRKLRSFLECQTFQSTSNQKKRPSSEEDKQLKKRR